MHGEGLTYGINGSFGSPQKRFSINFSKANTKFCLSLHFNGDNSCFLLMERKSLIFEIDNENINFPTQFCLRSISNGFSATEYKEISLKGRVYDFSIDYSDVDKSSILNIHK